MSVLRTNSQKWDHVQPKSRPHPMAAECSVGHIFHSYEKILVMNPRKALDLKQRPYMLRSEIMPQHMAWRDEFSP